MADHTVDRYELWDDFACAGGTRQAFIRDWIKAGESRRQRGPRADGDRGSDAVGEPGTFELPVSMLDSIWETVQEGWIVRQVFENAPFVEWPIVAITKNLDDGGERFGVLGCRGVMQELMYRSALLERVEANEDVNPHFELYQFPPTDHVDVILEAAPSFFAKGTIEPSVPVDMVYHRDTALSALKELAAVAEFSDGLIGAELDVRRNGTTNYLVDLVRQVGSSAEEVQIREAKQLLSTSTSSDIASVATRVYPKGGNTYAYEGSMARAQWEVGAQSGATLTMRDDIIGEDDQLNDLVVIEPDGTSHEITDSSAPATIVLDADPGDLVGTLLRFRRETSTGALAEVSYLESPSGVSKWGRRSHELDRTDIPAIDNLMPDPFFLQWQGDLPRDVQLVGSPLTQKETDRLYNRAGEASIHVAANESQGVESFPVDVIPTAERPFFVAQIQLYVVSGHVRLELVDVTNDRVFPPEDQEAVTVAEGVWIDSFGIAPGGEPDDNFFTRGTTQFRLRVIAEGGPAEWYLDAWMLLQQQSFAEEFYGGRASNDLWMLAKETLQQSQEPAQSYEVGIVDLYRLRQDADGPTFHGEEIVVGGDCRVVAESIDVDFETRIVEVRRNWGREGDTKVTLQEKTNALTSLINPASRRNRKKLETEVGQDVPGTTDCTNLTDPSVAPEEFQSTDSSGREVFHTYPPISLEDTELEVGGEIGFGWDGKVTPSGEPTGGEVSTDQTLKRTLSGLIDRDRFDRGSLGGDWTAREGAHFQTYDDKWIYTTGGVAEWSSQTPRGAQAIEVRMWLRDASEQEPRVYAKWDFNASDENSYYASIGTGWVKLFKDVNGTPTEIDAVATPIDSGQWYVVKLVVADGLQQVYLDGDLIIEANDTAHDGATGIPALGASDPDEDGVFFDDIILCPNNTITVNGLPGGWAVSTSGAGVTEETGGTAVHDLEGTHFVAGVISVRDEFDVHQGAFTPGGIFGGDEYLFDEGGELEGTSGFDVASLLALSFVDTNGTEIESTEGTHPGIKAFDYTRAQDRQTIPVGTVSIVPYAVRIGGGAGVAFIRRVQINQGEPCDFRVSEAEPPWRIPSDRDLVLDWPFDEREPTVAMNDGTGCETDQATQEEIVLANRRWDRSGRSNHGLIYTWDFDSQAWAQPAPAAAYMGLRHGVELINDPDFLWPSGIVVLEGAPFINVSDVNHPDDQAPVVPCADVTVCGVFDPVVSGEFGSWFAPGMDIWGRWFPDDETRTIDQGDVDFTRGGFFSFMSWNPDGPTLPGPFIGMVIDTDDNITTIQQGTANEFETPGGTLVWEADWLFDASPSGSDYKLLGKFVFICHRIQLQTGGTINVDCYYGDLSSHTLHKASPTLWGPAEESADHPPVPAHAGYQQLIQHAHGLPTIREIPGNETKWAAASRGLYEYDREDCLMSSDGFVGIYDEMKRYNRALSDAEIQGLFLTIAGRRHTGDVLWSDPTDAEKASIFNSTEHAK